MTLLPAVFGIVFNNDRTAILLVKRRDVPLWTLPGGGKEENETNEKALQREIKEETGCIVNIIRLCAIYTPVNRLAASTSIYMCQIESGVLSLSDETAAVAFHPLNKLPLSLFHIHAHWLNEALAHSTCIQRTLNEVSYYSLMKYFLRHPFNVIKFAWTRFFAGKR